MVFPVPNPPGTAAVPPFATGSSVSITLCPVINGFEMGLRSLDGRAVRMGHVWHMVSSVCFPPASSITAKTSQTACFPLSAVLIILPVTPFGTIILWIISVVSGTFAIIVPADTLSPFCTQISVSHCRSMSTAEMFKPRSINAPLFSSSTFRGRSIPSKMLPTKPGARVTDMGTPVDTTGSPGARPVVDS